MDEIIREIAIVIGGNTFVLTVFFILFKNFVVKYFENAVKSSFDKNYAKYKNQLERATKAYERILNKEIEFYDEKDSIVAKLIPNINDLFYYLENMKDRKSKDAIDGFKEIYWTNIKLIILLKNEILIHQNYLPQEIFNAYSKVVEQIQSGMKRWLEMAEYISAGNHEKMIMMKLKR